VPQEAVAIVQDLLLTNRGCSLPCWWGITPGKTTWDEARQFLLTFAVIEPDSTGSVTIDGQTYPVQAYHVDYAIDEDVRGGANLAVRGGLVTGILVGKTSTAQAFTLRDLLRGYGPPAKVLVNTYSVPGPSPDPQGLLPFRMVVLYGPPSFMAFYDMEGTLSGGTVIGCPGETAPWIRSWSEDQVANWTDERIQEVVMGPDSSALRPIEEVTSWDVAQFYSVFTSDNSNVCVETPAENW